MNPRRSLGERFWASRDWPLWKQLVVAGCALLLISALVAPLTRGHQEPSTADESPRQGFVPPATTTARTPAETLEPTSSIPTTTPALNVEPPTASNDTLPRSTFSTTGVSADASPAGATAFQILQRIPVQLEHRGGYDRDLFAVWSDLDGDGCDTRQEVLTRESLSPAQTDPHGCTAIAGVWYSAYDQAMTTAPSEFDIDHVVALKEAWDSGAWDWSPARRIAYANDVSDPRTLAAVSAESNQSKGDADPSNWLPSATGRCQYLGDWLAIKTRWSLSMDESEFGRIKNLLQGECKNITVRPWPAAPS